MQRSTGFESSAFRCCLPTPDLEMTDGRSRSDSFGARARLTAGATAVDYFSSAGARQGASAISSTGCRSASASCSRTCCATRTAGWCATRTSTRWRRGTPAAPAQREVPFMPARVLLQDFTGVPAVVDLAAMRDAMQRARRRPAPDQPADPGRPGHRPLGAGRSLRHRRRVRANVAHGVRAQPRALRVPALGAAEPSTTSASCRRTPASATR